MAFLVYCRPRWRRESRKNQPDWRTTRRQMSTRVTGEVSRPQGLRRAAWPDARHRRPVDTAVRSEQLTVSRVRHGPELYGKTIRIDDDPSTFFVGPPAPPRQAARRGED